jgi:trimethylamine--corrinoid protein Co-methyltransferase
VTEQRTTDDPARLETSAARVNAGHAVRRRPRRVDDRIPQLAPRQIRNPFPPVEVLSADQAEAIHEASLAILRDVGLEVLGDRAIDILRRAGALVDRGTRRVRLDPGLTEELVARAPGSFRLHARNPAWNLDIGGDNLVFCAVGGPAFVTDLDRGRRAGSLADLSDLTRLVQQLDILHQEGGGAVEPTDIPVPVRHLEMYRAFATLTDKTWQCLGFGRRPVDDAIDITCLVRGIDRDRLAREPSVMTVINTNTPLRLDGPMSDGLVEMALHAQPVIATPFTLAGAMSPATLAGALALQNAEALFMIALAQATRPGAPMVYGGFTSNVDMRSGSPAFGTPESVKGQLATGQLARRYGVPWRSSNTTASSVVDAQAAYESEMSLWGCVLGGANLVYHAAGWLEGGLTASFEKLVLDAELLQQIAEVLRPIVVDAAELGLDAIAEVGPGGHFFASAHTLERYETAFYRPMLSDWRNFETWSDDGARTATERANGIWKRLLAEYTPPPMDAATREALDTFVERRKAEIGRDG